MGTLKFEVGKFYHHEHGRSIAVLAKVNTFKWGEMLVIEETDPTGHSISTVQAGAEDLHERWVEIGKPEWERNFNRVRKDQ